MQSSTNLKIKDNKIQFPDKIFVVARGGRTVDREDSHKYGQVVINILKENNLKVKDLYIHPNGMYTLDGSLVDVHKVMPEFHYVWIALIGLDGASGELQSLCDKYNIKYGGEKLFHSSLSHHKYNLKKLVKQHGIKTNFAHLSVKGNVKDEALKAFGLIGIPVEVSSHKSKLENKVHIANSFAELEKILASIFENNDEAILERGMKGEAVTVFISKEENIINTSIFSDSETLRNDKSKIIKIRNEALNIYNGLGFSDFIEVDFMVNEKDAIFKDLNTHPNLLSDRYLDLWASPNFDFREFVMSRVLA